MKNMRLFLIVGSAFLLAMASATLGPCRDDDTSDLVVEFSGNPVVTPNGEGTMVTFNYTVISMVPAEAIVTVALDGSPVKIQDIAAGDVNHGGGWTFARLRWIADGSYTAELSAGDHTLHVCATRGAKRNPNKTACNTQQVTTNNSPPGSGSGGYLYIINATPYNWYQTSQHSFQMNSWSFPWMIPPGTTRVYIEWNQGVGKCWCDDGGDVYYYIFDDRYNPAFHIHATGQCGDCKLPPHYAIKNTWEPTNDTEDIGFRWNSSSPSGGTSLMILGDKSEGYNIVEEESGADWWMSGIPDSRLLSTLTIPGTHDSSTFNYSGVAGLWVWTQDLNFTDQLIAGIRFLDMRCTSINNKCELYHATYDLGISLDYALNQIVPFLQRQYRETVLMSIDQENPPGPSSLALDRVINNYVQSNPGMWYTKNSIPTLGEVRGKIVLLRRYGAATYPLGIDLSNWPDDTTFTLTNSGGVTYSVQDHYDPLPGTKEQDIYNEFNAAKVNSPNTLYVNFTSGYNVPLYDPQKYANWSINPWLYSGLQYHMGDANIPVRARLGIVPMNDFDTADSASEYASPIARRDLPLLLVSYNNLDVMQGNEEDAVLRPGQWILSRSGEYELVYQSDGNLVEYYHPGPGQTAVWASNTITSSPGYAEMQSDGNFVLYDSGENAYWATGTIGNPNSTLLIEDDGSLVIQNSVGQNLWHVN